MQLLNVIAAFLAITTRALAVRSLGFRSLASPRSYPIPMLTYIVSFSSSRMGVMDHLTSPIQQS